MAIIKPSLKFAGSELNLSANAAPYLNDTVRRAVFNKSTNQEGAYLYFLPPYKADHEGNGVWYKKITIRDNFGTNFKEKYYVPDKANDPAEHFANSFKILYNEDSKIREEEVNGKKFKKYPSYGRTTERVLYNVAFSQSLQAGCHVLDLPLRNGADTLMGWVYGKDIAGNPRPPINEPTRCIPVFVKLKESSTNPWMIQPESSQAIQLPEQLADSDYLYNLDDVLVIKSKEEIIGKLREMYSSDVFEACMSNYPGLASKSTVHMSHPVARPAAPVPPPAPEPEPAPAPAPVINIPKANVGTATAVPAAMPQVDISSLPANPMASGNKLSREEAMKFIRGEG
jgi:hypothetical protein